MSENKEHDICEVFCVDKEKVERLKYKVESTGGLSLLFKALADDTRVKSLCLFPGGTLRV